MRKNIFVIIIVMMLIFSFILFKLSKKTYASDLEEDNYYNLPIIAMVSTDNSSAIIKAGRYYYGDLDLNGKINDTDIKYMNSLLNETLSFNSEHKKLVDFDNDGVITSNDLELLMNYVNNHNNLSYDITIDSIKYCISHEDNYNNCNWQEANTIKLDNEGIYYAFVKDGDNKVSFSYKFEFKKINLNDRYVID